jgi:GMP synthase (glutamine-hydrolysing)
MGSSRTRNRHRGCVLSIDNSPEPVTVLVLEHEPDAGLSLMTGHLGTKAQIVRPYLGEQLPDLTAFDGLIVLGGSMAAWEDEVAPWLPDTRRLLTQAVRTAVPTLGICLGAQLLALACGGNVERGAEGLELGVVPVTPLPAVDDDPFFAAVQRELGQQPAGPIEAGEIPWPVHQYHRDAITRLPADAELLVTGDRYRQQGFRVAATAWGVQYHPEVATELFVDWVRSSLDSGALTPDAADVLGPVQAGSGTQSLVAAVHARAFLDLATARTR